MKNLFFFLLYLCLTQVVVAEQTEKNNLQPQQLQDSLNKYYKKDSNKFFYFANQLKQYYQEKNDIKNLIILENKISYQYTITGELPEAIKNIDYAIDLSSEIKNDSLMGISYITKAAIYFYQKDYLTSIKYFSKADSLSSNEIEKTNILRNYAFIKKDLGDYLGAIQIYKKIYYSYENSVGYEGLRFINLLDIINAYMDYNSRYKNHPEFNDSIEKYIKIAQKYNYEQTYIKELLAMAINSFELYKNPDKGEKVINNLDSIMNILWQQNIHYVDPAFYYDKAKYYYHQKDYEKALHYLKKIEKSNANWYKSMYADKIYMLYSQIYQAIGDTGKALEKTMRLNQMLREKEQQRILVDKILRDQYDYKIINKRIQELEEKVHKESNINTYLFTGLFILLLFYISNLNKRKITKKNYQKIIQELDNRINNLKTEKDLPQPKKRSKSLPPDKIYQEILAKLKEFEENYIFLDQNIDLDFMVDFIGYNKSYVSGVINDHYKMNLKDYINKLRIDYALEQMKNPDLILSYNIKGMAEEFGFKTSKTFGAAFKKFTGMHPSEFIKQAKKELFQ